MRWALVLTVVLVPGVAASQNTQQTPAACERLASLSLPNTTITLAQVVNAGAFAVPVNRRHEMAAALLPLPARSVLFRTCPGE